jgi:hypothetical protein
MKKLILFFALLLFAVGVEAQSGSTVLFGNSTYAKYNPVASDTIGGTATKYWVFFVNKPDLYYYVGTVRLTQLLVNPLGTGTGRTTANHVTLTLAGSIDGTYYVDLDTCLVHPTTTATTLQNMSRTLNWTSDVSTGILWRYLKVTATGGDATRGATLTSLALKIGLKK